MNRLIKLALPVGPGPGPGPGPGGPGVFVAGPVTPPYQAVFGPVFGPAPAPGQPAWSYSGVPGVLLPGQYYVFSPMFAGPGGPSVVVAAHSNP